MADAGIHVAAVLGTARDGNYTRHALALVVDELGRREVAVTVLDAAALTLALPGAGESPDGSTLREAVHGADAVILATPEYHGSFSAAMKLVIENLGFPSVLGRQAHSIAGRGRRKDRGHQVARTPAQRGVACRCHRVTRSGFHSAGSRCVRC